MHILLSQVYCVWQVIKTPKIISNNPVYSPSTTKKMQRFSNLFISVRRSTCFRRFFRPSQGAQNCTYSVRYLSDRYCYRLLAAGSRYLTLYVQFCAPDDGRENLLRYVERLTEINKFEKRCILLVVLWEVTSLINTKLFSIKLLRTENKPTYEENGK